MNILADKQLEMLEKNISEEEYEKRKKEFFELYYQVRNKDDQMIWNNLTLSQRKFLHPLILGVYQLKNFITGYKSYIISDKRTKTDRPFIFVPSHVGKSDIELLSVKLLSHYYLLSGDYEHIQGTVTSKFLSLNGILYFNEKDKEDRAAIVGKMINHLNEGGNLLYFIEGTWNMSPNLPMLPCYWGIVDIARKANAIIVPIGVDQYGKEFPINIGENFDVLNYPDTIEGKSNAINDLRGIIAGLKWDIWETKADSRVSIDLNYWEDYKKERYAEWIYFNDEYIDKLVFKPKGIVGREEVYASVRKIVPNHNNAFLYNKRHKDDIYLK